MSTENSGGERGTDDLAWPGFAGLLREQWEAFRYTPLSVLLWRRLKRLLVVYFLLMLLQSAASVGTLFLKPEELSNITLVLATFGTMCLTTLGLLVLYYGLLFLYGAHAYKRTWEDDETLRLTALTQGERIAGVTALLTMGMLLATSPNFLFLVVQAAAGATAVIIDLLTAGHILLTMLFTLAALAALALQLTGLFFAIIFTFHHVTFRLLLKEATKRRPRPEGWWPIVRSYAAHAIYTALLFLMAGLTAQLAPFIVEGEAFGIWAGERGALIIYLAILSIMAAVLYAWAAYFRRSYRKDMEKARGVLFVAEE